MIQRAVYSKALSFIIRYRRGIFMKRVAVTHEDGRVFQRFGHTPQFKFYNIDQGKTYREQIIDTPSKKGHAALTSFLKKMSTDVLICGSLGEGAQKALKAAGITVYPGISGNADLAAISYLLGTLPKNEIVTNEHHHCEDAL